MDDRVLGQVPVVALGRTGVTAFMVAGLEPGHHEITATYLGNESVAPGSATRPVTVFTPGRASCLPIIGRC